MILPIRRKRLLQTIPFVAVSLLCVVSIFALASCQTGRVSPTPMLDRSADPSSAALEKNLPLIRVRLNAKPVRSAQLSSTIGYKYITGGKTIVDSDSARSPAKITRSGKTWKINSLNAREDGDVLTFEPKGSGTVQYNGFAYRGTITLIPVGTNDFYAVNHVSLEGYLYGVLAKELYPSWPLPTYRALAVAARTFALYQMTTFGQDHDWDVMNDQSSQVYGGMSAETDKSKKAVNSTHGWVLTFGPEGKEKLFMPNYSACCGGTVNPTRTLRNAPAIRPHRGGQVCNTCSDCPKYRWEKLTLPKRDIHDALVKNYGKKWTLSDLKTITPKDETFSGSGRAVNVIISDSRGKTSQIRAEDLRIVLLRHEPDAKNKLYSMNCLIVDTGDSIEFADGKGMGHGTGLCQWGANGKVKEGWNARKILEFYYPGSVIYRAY